MLHTRFRWMISVHVSPVSRPVLRDPRQPQALFQYTDLQFRILQPVLVALQLIAHRCKQRPGKLPLQLFDHIKLGRSRCRGHRRWVRTGAALTMSY